MQTTSALYKTIVAGVHSFETKVTLNGNTVNANNIMQLSRERNGMPSEQPSIGGALCSTLNLRLLTPNYTIPLLAEIDVYVRATDGTNTSDWIPQGVYFVDTRKANESSGAIGTMDITAFDAMAKTDADYPDTNHNWPYLDKSVVAEIATTIGVTVDSRTNSFLTAGYYWDLPIGYTMRETLEQIAAAYGGNFVITAENKLLFVPLYGLDSDSWVTGNYLAEENGNALTFGNEGWCILV